MEGTNLGILNLIPALSFFVFAFVTRKCIFSILLSGILGYLLYYGPDFFMPTVDALLDATCDSDNNYIVFFTYIWHFSFLSLFYTCIKMFFYFLHILLLFQKF